MVWTATSAMVSPPGRFSFNVKGGRCELKNLKISGNGISFEVAHRIANLRMGVTLELEDATLKGEGLPIDFDENSCDIVLRRQQYR